MSHQARTDLSELGYTGAARCDGARRSLIQQFSHCRTCYCRTYSYVCFCASVLPLPGTPIPHRSTNDGVELPDGTPRGVRDLYPVWLPWFSAPPRSPSFSSFHASFLSLLLLSPRRPANRSPRSAVRAAPSLLPPRCFAKHNVCIRTLDRPRNPHFVPTRATIIDGPPALSPFP